MHSRCITLQGDDFNPSGLLTGGSRSNQASLLAGLHDLAQAEARWGKGGRWGRKFIRLTPLFFPPTPITTYLSSPPYVWPRPALPVFTSHLLPPACPLLMRRLSELKAELQQVDQRLGAMAGAAKEHKR